MREVEVERFVAAPPAAVGRLLSPAALVEYEGSFSARATREESVVERSETTNRAGNEATREEDDPSNRAGSEATREDGAATVVTVAGGGLEFDLRFVETAGGGWRYEQAGERGPFDSMETEVTVRAANEGSRVRAVSRVSLGLPLPLADRVAGWKRRGELRRLLDALAADAE